MRLVLGCPINLPLEAFRDGAVDLISTLWKEECATCSGREQLPLGPVALEKTQRRDLGLGHPESLGTRVLR